MQLQPQQIDLKAEFPGTTADMEAEITAAMDATIAEYEAKGYKPATTPQKWFVAQMGAWFFYLNMRLNYH